MEEYMEIEYVINKVLSATGFTNQDMASDKRTEISVYELFESLILFKDRKAAAEHLSITKSKLEYILRTRVSPLVPKIQQEQWHVHLLELAGFRRCFKCDAIKEVSDFTRDISRKSGINGQCKQCACKSTALFRLANPEYSKEYRQANPEQHKEYCATYAATKLGATPKWADLNKIKTIYKNCPTGMHVDHIIPLRGELVCGLHVENNLQYLSPEQNRIKSNKFDVVVT